jgi:hypothetical protein
MAKLTKKALIGIIVVVAIVVACVSVFLLTRPSKLYELSLNYKPGETYIYDMVQTTEAAGQKIETQMKAKVDILEVKANEITMRYDMSMQTLQPPQTITMVWTQTLTNKGEMKSWEIENVEPPEFRELMEQTVEQMLEQQKMEATFPPKPLPIGGKWTTPIDYELKLPEFQLTSTGKSENKLEGKERIKVPAGEFDCFKLTYKMHVVGEGLMGKDQTMTMELIGNTTIWIDRESGATIKSETYMEEDMKIGTALAMKVPVDSEMELIEYIP